MPQQLTDLDAADLRKQKLSRASVVLGGRPVVDLRQNADLDNLIYSFAAASLAAASRVRAEVSKSTVTGTTCPIGSNIVHVELLEREVTDCN